MRLFRQGEDPATATMIVIAAVTLAGSLIVMLTVPKPSTFGLDQAHRKTEFRLRLRNDKAAEKLEVKQASIVSQTWNVPEQQIGPQALAKVTRLVSQNRLKLVSFRPQRKNEDGRFVQLPYLLTVDGSFPAVLSLTRQLEDPSLKLAVSLVQVASADAASDRVTASIGLVALISPTMETETTSG